MQTAATAVFTVLRIAWLIQLALGLLFWSGNALALIPIHMRVGFLVVLSLWALALIAAVRGVNPVLTALAFAWGVVIPIVGLTQAQILPGQYHAIVKVFHLLLGVGAIALGERLHERIGADAKFPVTP